MKEEGHNMKGILLTILLSISGNVMCFSNENKTHIHSLNSINQDLLYDEEEPEEPIDEISGTISPTANYILTSFSNPAITPNVYFRQMPTYSGVYDYSNVRVGDIIIETKTIGENVGHSAFISDIAHTYSGGTYIQTIEAVAQGVSYGFLDDFRMINYGVVILRPINVTNSNIATAYNFQLGQIGEPYDFPISPRINTSYEAESWYCSELIYAAYLSANVPLLLPENNSYLMPRDILQSTSCTFCTIGNYLDLKYIGKTSSNKWSMYVFNCSSETVTVYYNTKMCFENDAKNWSGLSNVSSFTLSPNTYSRVEISTNLFATCCAFSQVVGSDRYITYCKNLNSDAARMTILKVKK